MRKRPRNPARAGPWTSIPDTEERFSTGVPDFDRLLGGGFRRGSMALFEIDETVDPADLELVWTPILLNFLYQSNGVLAVLPSRLAPHEFRTHLTRWTSRRRFDSRVRIITYVGEDTEAPYVVDLRSATSARPSPRARRNISKAMRDMAAAEKAVRGVRQRMFLELVAFEIAEMVAGPEVAIRMFFHGIKRVRGVGNLCLGILRPGLRCADAVRGMADVALALRHGDSGLVVRGVRPSFPGHLVVPEARQGSPHLSLVPTT